MSVISRDWSFLVRVFSHDANRPPCRDGAVTSGVQRHPDRTGFTGSA